MMIERLKANLANVEARIEESAVRAGRRRDDVRLIAVTKSATVPQAAALVEVGCHELAENRPQVLWEKAAALNDSRIQWHLVGTLQRNKIRRTLPWVSMIHSLDSLRLAEAIDRIAGELRRQVDVLLEVNVSREPAKHGFRSDEVEPALHRLADFSALRICGLMCISGLQSDSEQRRREFAELRALRNHLQSVAPQGLQLRELSMGMSDDFELAVAEGATMIRLGTILLEGL
jgi:pyridoxal phosphate enzyme (YggS family)